ncbi:LysR substrate-binding domain-containing protein [Sphingosinicella terrae]|uniref:LysR substrate-binding domain-containing protein n=1 Tax=Sphingosinicella terrae TaxID=2172047 RepID=UPI000E0D2C0E|nr:LysR substrate-binding domain-containing protein [Sphingosinicella terrae]
MVAPSHLKALQALELAARKGSLREAAEALAITPAAVGQRIRALEDYLGVTLLERGRSGIRPTASLAAALPHLHHAFSGLEAAARELDLQRGHEIHIAATSDLAELWLAPRLARFREANPATLFCINGEGDVPMRLGRVDCEISYGAVREDGLADTLFHDYVLPVCSPSNLARTAALPAAGRLEGFPLLHLDFYRNDPAGLSWSRWIAAAGAARSAPERGMRFQRITAALGAVRADAGIALCGLALIADDVEEGRMKLPYPVASGLWGEHAFVARYRADAAARPHVARFRAWLSEESAETARWLGETAGGTAAGRSREPRIG